MRAASSSSRGLAEDARAERNRGVGAHDRRRREPARGEPAFGGAQLGARHALDVVRRQLAVARRLERLDVLVGAGEQQLVADADLLEQLAPARALRREIDERCVGAFGRHRFGPRLFAVVRMAGVDRPRAVERLGDDDADERVRQRQVGKAKRLVAARLQRRVEPVGAADDERGVAPFALPGDDARRELARR